MHKHINGTGPRRKTSARRAADAPDLHRIRDVRIQEHISLRTVAQKSGVSITQLRLQEMPSVDLRLSDLYRWQQALDLPVSELLAEPENALSEPLRQRAVMVRVAKTALSIAEEARSESVQCLAQTLIGYLQELMPGINAVSAWPQVGQRSNRTRWGRAALLQLPVDFSDIESACED